MVSFILDNNLKEEKNIYKRIKMDEDFSILTLCVSNKDQALIEDFFQSTLDIWVNGENPILLGKQVITYKFLLNDLNGRRIISSMKNIEDNGRYLVVEGGLRIDLGTCFGYHRQNIGINDIGVFSINDINDISMNPCYALGKNYYPVEIYYFWQKAFLYVISISDIKWNKNNLKKTYKKFLEFLESEICGVMNADSIISEDLFYKVLLRHIKMTRSYLKGNYESVISKDYLLFLRNCLPFIRPIKLLLSDILLENKNNKFDLDYYQTLIKSIDDGNNYQRGISLEVVVEYLLKNSMDFKVMAKREKTSREEIDISCCNISDDYELWRMGAFLHVECKNWNKKIGVKTIRELGYIMFYKGNTTTLLITKNGVTKNSLEEIKKLALQGKYILVFDLKELELISSIEYFMSDLKNKFDILQIMVENEISHLGE